MSRDMVIEPVPRMSRRVGDNLIAGSNNSTILLGRDRLNKVDSGYGTGPGAGAIHLIVGRVSEDPSITDDAATLYLSAKSDPDTAAGTDVIGRSSSGKPSAILRADCIRVSARSDMKLSVGKSYLTLESGGKITLEGDISLGFAAVERALKADTYRIAESTKNSVLLTSYAAIAAMATALGAYPVLIPVSAACVAAASAMAAAISATTSFETSSATYLSSTVKLK